MAAAAASSSPRSVLEYLQTLSEAERSALFDDAFSALTLFRSLPPLAKQYLMRLIHVEHPVTLAAMERWCNLPALSLHQAALVRLLELGILTLTVPPATASSADMDLGGGDVDLFGGSGGDIQPDPASAAEADQRGARHQPAFNVVVRAADPRSTVMCNPCFAKSLRSALANEVPELGSHRLGPDQYAPDPKQLDEESRARWQSLLHYLVGSITGEPPAQGIRDMLLSMGLMRRCSPSVMMQYQSQVHLNKNPLAAAAANKQKRRRDGEESDDSDDAEAEWGEQEAVKQQRERAAADRLANPENVIITGKGFSFLFKDTHTQVWQLIMAYVDSCEQRGLSRNEILPLLFQLAFLEPGRDYSTEGKTKSQQVFISDLARFGLLYQRKATSRRFYATPLTLCLSPNPPPPNRSKDLAAQSAGFLIVETTFRVYSFSTSPLHQSLLQMFVRMEYDLPSLMIGTITKASVRHALRHGISARDMVSYMTECAHPQQRTRVPLLPTNVVDQLLLWEQEQSRLCVQPAVRYQFAAPAGDRAENPIFHATVRQLQGNGAMLWNDGRSRLLTPEGNWDASLNRIRQQVQREQLQSSGKGAAPGLSKGPEER